jgi:hypothetical protein
MRAASVEEAMAALANMPGGLDWKGAAGVVVPLFQRVRPYPPGFPEGVRHVLPPGISVTFGVDTGPAFVHVTPEVLARWERSIGEVAECALENLHRRAAVVKPASVLRDSVADVPLQALQSGTGSASTFVLVPDELPRIFGSPLGLFIAPMRDLLIELPADVDREFAAWLHAEFSAPDPNCLAPLAFRVASGRLVVEPLGAPAAIA